MKVKSVNGGKGGGGVGCEKMGTEWEKCGTCVVI